MSTHLPGFWSFSGFLHHFVLTKLATSSILVNGLKAPLTTHLSIPHICLVTCCLPAQLQLGCPSLRNTLSYLYTKFQVNLLPFDTQNACVTLPMLRPLSSKTQGCKDFRKSSKPCHVGIHWIALIEYCQMSTHVPGFQSFLRIFASFCICQSSLFSVFLYYVVLAK